MQGSKDGKRVKEESWNDLGLCRVEFSKTFCKGPESNYLRLCGPYHWLQLPSPAIGVWKQPQRKCQQMSRAVFQQLDSQALKFEFYGIFTCHKTFFKFFFFNHLIRPFLGGKVFANHICNNGIISKICKEFIQLKTKNPTTNPILKWAKNLNRHITKDIQMAENYHVQSHYSPCKCKS